MPTLPFPAYLNRRALLAAVPASFLPIPGLAFEVRPQAWAPLVTPEIPGLPNLYQVAPNLYRSAQPDAEGMRNLETLGVRAVLSMRQTVSDTPLAAGTGLVLYRVPMKSRYVGEKNGAKVVQAMRDLRQGMQAGPVLVHCHHGADRTGLIAALWRVLYEGWSRQAAIDEMIEGGFGFHPIWSNIPRYLRRVDLIALRERIEIMMEDYADWQQGRLALVTAEDGWLNVTDRFDVPQGPQRVGSAPDNDLVLSVGPAHLGILEATERAARLTVDGSTLDFVKDGANPKLRIAGLLLEVHPVLGAPSLRVRDLGLPRAVTLDYYPYDPAWVINARWEALAAPHAQTVEQKGAAPTEVALTHRAHFSHDGHEVTLLATHWKGTSPMFVLRDATSGVETYGASRFLIAEPAGDSITLDFNRAYNPPCAFTDFAICPLPPRENRLPFAIRAGERKLAS